MPLIAQGLPPLLNARRTRGKDHVALYASFVGSYHYPVPPHRLEDLQLKWPNRRIRGLAGRATGTMKSELMTIDCETQATIQDAKIGITAHPYAKIETAIPRVAVIPITVVEKPVAARRMDNRLSGLVDRIIVKLR